MQNHIRLIYNTLTWQQRQITTNFNEYFTLTATVSKPRKQLIALLNMYNTYTQLLIMARQN